VAPASPLQEAVAFAAAERVGSGSARADWVQDERFRDDYSAVLSADDSSLGGYSELAVSAVAQEGDSSPGD